MIKYARIDGDGVVQEYREFPEDHPPVDIPHKQVRWLPVVAEDRPDVDGLTETIEASISVQKDRVVRGWAVSQRDISQVKPAAIERVMASYRDRIVDALPDMTAVTALTNERDERVRTIRAAATGAAVRRVTPVIRGA